MKIIEKIKKNQYRYINITALFLALYTLIYPFISKIIERINPLLTKCVYLELTGKPCPLCGGTRFIRNIDQVFVDYRYIFNFFGIAFSFIIFEIIFRIVNIFKLKKNKLKNNTILFDIIIHIIAFILFILYEILFIIYS